MDVVDTRALAFKKGPGHRDDGVRLKDVFTGTPGPDNYWFVLIKVEDTYDTPPHRHNFEQVRVLLEGRFNFGPRDMDEGSIGYFCEGTPYRQEARGPSLTLLLQCEGESRARYLSLGEIGAAVAELRASGGVFADGRYIGPDRDGTVRECDSYEAIWESVTHRPIAYADARYDAPVIMTRDRFRFEATSEPGVEQRFFGGFGGRRLTLREIRIHGGTDAVIEAQAQSALLYLLSGSGRLAETGLEPGYAVRLSSGESMTIRADDMLTFLRIDLPAG